MQEINLTDTAKIIRKVLKETPTVKFSVRSSRFSCGSAIDVHWAGGAKQKDVEQAIGFFKAGHFDGMTDCYEYGNHNSKDGKTYFFSNSYLTIQRDFEPDWAKEVLAIANKKYGTDHKDYFQMCCDGYRLYDRIFERDIELEALFQEEFGSHIPSCQER